MATFAYTARTQDGKVVRATADAPARQQALSNLQAQGLTILSLEPAAVASGSGAGRDRSKTKTRRIRVGMGDMAVFCRQLAVAISAGVPLRDALELIGSDLDHAGLKRVIRRTIGRLDEGRPFSTAVEEERETFGAMFVGLMRVAEEAGSLPDTLEQLASYTERNDRLVRKLRGMTMYPLFIGAFFILVCIVMTLFIVPQFRAIFAGREAALPKLTLMVFNTNRFILDHLIGFTVSVAVIVAGLTVALRSSTGRAVADRLKFGMPVIGKCFRKIAIARICRNLGLMARSGVSITTALDISSMIAGSGRITKSLLAARDRIVTGSDIAGSLAQDPEFPRLVVRMVSVGESSGRLPEVFDKIADTYDSQVETALTMATTLLEPVLICFFGGIILMLVLAIYMPVFTISSAAQ